METSKHARDLFDFDPEAATAEEAEELLVRWDELPADTLARIATHPRLGARLRKLQLAEAWLREQGPSDRPIAVARCPALDELYDYGHGPGAAPLAAQRRAEIDRHVLGCRACRELAATLASRPPSPLDLGDGGHQPQPASRHPRAATKWGPRATMTRGRRLALPLAAAALALAALALTLRNDAAPVAERGLPGAPLLRGSEVEALLAPRDRVLAAAREGAWHGIASRPTPLFELLAVEGAGEYRVELERSGDGAFSGGVRVSELHVAPDAEGPGPLVAVLGPALEPGRYTWRAWARVRGLDRELGARDFEVRSDGALERELAALARAAEPARTEAAVRILDRAGYLADARALARTLPASAERDAYLARAPSR